MRSLAAYLRALKGAAPLKQVAADSFRDGLQ